MNVSELARRLKIDTTEMLEKLPGLGFDIGRRAIKIDDRIADNIIKAWKETEKKDREMSQITKVRAEAGVGEKKETAVQENKEITMPAVVTVREFAALLGLPVNRVLTELMKNGVLTSINERIDFETAAIIGENLGFKIITDAKDGDQTAMDDSVGQKKLDDLVQNRADGLPPRSPVVVVMGHVDHGKTKILDTIRKADVAAGESGGITQHIGAYQVAVKPKNGKGSAAKITFLDTPGHEAFTAMRSRGAKVADIAVLVVAADDGIQLQTKEAIKIIQDAKLPYIVAINKMDKPDANLEKVKNDLAQVGLLPEDWGGKTPCLPVSALTGQGIDDLLETIVLMTEMELKNFTADRDCPAIGTIIESHIDKGEGPVATILVQAGTLRVGDVLSIGSDFYGKVRSLRDYKGETVKEAIPSMPVKVVGLKILPGVGSIMETAHDLKTLNKDFKKQKLYQEKDFSAKSVATENLGDDVQFVNLIIKADVLGSVEAIIESLAKLDTDKIKVRVIGKGLGLITEADVMKAEATGARIFGFHVKPSTAVENLAREKNIVIKVHGVIYHLIEDVQAEMNLLKQAIAVKKLVGKLKVIKVFRQENKNMIVGGQVLEGGLCLCDMVVVMRGDQPIASGKVNRLECMRQVVNQVNAGQECGVNFEGQPVIQPGDILEFYEEIKKA